MAQIVLVDVVDSGYSVSMASASSGGDYFENNGKVVIKITNGSGSSIDVTFDAPNVCSQGHNHDSVVAVGAGETKYVGNFDTKQYNTDGKINISYSDVTSLTIGGMIIN